MFSPNKVERKSTALLILYLGHSDKKFSKMAVKYGLLAQIESYYCVSITSEFSLERKKSIKSVLKRDPEFMKDETKSNKLLIKHIPKDSPSRKTKIATFTELKYYLRIDRYDRIPDPMNSVLWFFSCDEDVRMLTFLGLDDYRSHARLTTPKKATRNHNRRSRKRIRRMQALENLDFSKKKEEKTERNDTDKPQNKPRRIRRRFTSFKLSQTDGSKIRRRSSSKKKRIKTTSSFQISQLSFSNYIHKHRLESMNLKRRTSIENNLIEKEITMDRIFAKEREYLKKERMLNKKKKRSKIRVHRKTDPSFNGANDVSPKEKKEEKGYFFFKKMRRKRLENAETSSN